MEDQDQTQPSEKTIVRFDLVGSKKITDFLAIYSGLKGIEGFLEKITLLRDDSLKKVISEERHRNNSVLRTEGDAAYLIFDNADNAYLFAEEFLKNSNEKKFPFRIAAATGDTSKIRVRNLENSDSKKFNELKTYFSFMQRLSESTSTYSEEVRKFFEDYKNLLDVVDYNELLKTHNSLQEKFSFETIGKPLSDAVRLEVYGSKPGGFCVDEKTYEKFSPDIKNRNKFNSIFVKGKEGEEKITAWYCQIITEETQRNIPSPEDVVKALQLLNYTKPQEQFKELTKQKTAAVIIQGRNKLIQNWLIHRLLHKVPSYSCSTNQKSGQIYPINFTLHFTIELISSDSKINKIKEYIFNQLKPHILPNYNSNPFNQERDCDALFEELFKKIQQEPVIIIMRDLKYLTKYENELFQTIYDFWNCIFKKMNPNLKDLKVQSRIVLLLVLESQKQKEIFTNENFNIIPIMETTDQNTKRELNRELFIMPPLDEICSHDVQEWLEEDNVRKCSPLTKKRYDDILNDGIQSLEGPTENVIENICRYIFRLDRGMAEIEESLKIETIQVKND